MHSLAAGKIVKEEGKDNDLLLRLAEDDGIPFTLSDLEGMVNNFHQFTGRAREQTEEYLHEVVMPRLVSFKNVLGKIDAELSV
jgi:adenylosuccinate lyase